MTQPSGRVQRRLRRVGARAGPRLHDAARAFAVNLRQGDLRRAQGAFALAWGAEWAFTVALGVAAFREGGAAAVGLVGLLRMWPAAVVTPFASALADRLRRERILVWGSVIRAAATAAIAAVLAAGGPIAAVYGLAVVSTLAVTPFRAAHSALLPSLCRTTEELTSSNVVRGMLDSLSMLAGPAAAGALIGLTSIEVAFAAAAGAALAAAALLTRLEYEAPPRESASGPLHLWSDTVAGVRASVADRDTALMIGMGITQTFIRGCLNVFLVVVAIELLGLGGAGVGALTAAIGVGAVVGSVGASLLVGSHSMARWFGISVVLWGVPLMLIGAAPGAVVAVAALAVVGLGNAVLDVAFFTVMARLVPDAVLARVYGMLESLIALTVGLGSIATPLLIEVLGLRGALAAVGSIGAVATALAWARLRRIDGQMEVRTGTIELLQTVPMLRPLPMATIEHLARLAGTRTLAAGEVLFREGAQGDTFYVISAGEVELWRDGERCHVLGRGEAFGEIALLRSVPRTMTAIAQGPVTAYTLSARSFVPAVGGYTASAGVAEALVDSRLDGLEPEPAP